MRKTLIVLLMIFAFLSPVGAYSFHAVHGDIGNDEDEIQYSDTETITENVLPEYNPSYEEPNVVLEVPVLEGQEEINAVEIDTSEYSTDATGIKFSEEAVPEEFEVLVNDTNNSVTISLEDGSESEHTQTIGIPTSMLEGFTEAVTVDHYDENGVLLDSCVVYPEVINGFAYVTVELSTVTIYPSLNRIKNYSFENGVTGSVPNYWTVTGTGAVINVPYAAHASNCYKIEPDGSLHTCILSQWNGISGSPMARRNKFVGAWVNITGMTSGMVTIDLYNSSYGADSTGIVMTGNTNGWIYVQSATEYTNGNVIRVFDTNVNQGAVILVDGVYENYNAASVSAIETASADQTTVYQSFTINFPVATTGTGTQWVASQFSVYPLENHGKCSVTATIDGSSRPAEIVGNTVFIDASTSGTGNHAVVITVKVNQAPVLIDPPAGGSYTLSGIGFGAYQFAWDWTNTTNKLEIATDSGFTNIIKSEVVDSDTSKGGRNHGNSSYVAMPTGSFWWRVSSYDKQFETWNTSSTRTLTLTNPTIAGTGVTGMVYFGSDYIPVNGATVTVYNETWSKVVTTGVSGIYNVTLSPGPDWRNESTYYVSVGADGYQSVLSSYPFNLTATPGYLNLVNVQLVKEKDQFTPTDMNIRVMRLGAGWFYSWATGSITGSWNVYNSITGEFVNSGNLDSTGAFVVHDVEEGVNYRVVVSVGGDSYTEYFIPSSSKNSFMMFLTSDIEVTPANEFYDAVNVTMETGTYNASAAWVNVSYVDEDSTTTGMTVEIGEYDENQTWIPLFTSSVVDSGVGAETCSVLVINYDGESYIVKISITGSNYGTQVIEKPVAFMRSDLPFGNSKIISVLAVIIILIVARMFSATNMEEGAVIVCIVASLLWWFGMFYPLGDAVNSQIKYGLLIATSFAVINALRRDN